MKTPLLPADHLRRIFSVTDGVLYWNMNRDTLGIVKGDPVTTIIDPDGYVTVRVFDRRVMVHCLIYKIVMGEEPEQVDHRDQDKTNNRIENLRAATHAENQANREGWSDGYKGVYPSGKKFRAMISLDGTPTHIGTYDTEEAAARAYDSAARINFGEFAHTNFENNNDT